jgi:hypothetical protein
VTAAMRLPTRVTISFAAASEDSFVLAKVCW